MHLISNSFNFSWIFEGFFNNHGYNFDDISKNGYPGLLKATVFQNKVDDVMITTYYVNNKILSRDSSYIVDVVMWQKFGNSSISVGELIITSIL